MKGKIRVSHNYSIFGSAARGMAEVEDRAKSILAEKETCENINIFAKAIAADWNTAETNAASLKLAFSDFEKILEKRNPEISQFLTKERENRRAKGSAVQLHDSRVI
jgi:hypothetical protein